MDCARGISQTKWTSGSTRALCYQARDRRREPTEEDMTNTTSPPPWDPVAVASQLQTIAGQSQRLMQGFLTKQSTGGQIGMGDTSALGGAFLDLMTKMMSDPTAVANAQIDLFNDSMTVWRHAAERMFLMRRKTQSRQGTRGSSILIGPRTRRSALSAKATSSPRSRFCSRSATSKASIRRRRKRWISTRVSSSTRCRPRTSSPPIRRC
jgi:hypothetical protein